MKRLTIAILGACLAAATVLVQAQAAVPAPLTTQQDKLSYSMGVMTGRAFKAHKLGINPTVFSAGLQAGISGSKTQMTAAQMHATLIAFQKQSMEKLQTQMKALAAKNQQQGTQFLAANKSKPGVKTLADGLQYKVINPGEGTSPSLDDVVTVNYEGRLIDGKIFDSSYKRGKPATFPVTSVIPGWQQALVKMKPGATWEIYIPPALAYGVHGAPGVIGPNETLIFKVNLIAIKSKS